MQIKIDHELIDAPANPVTGSDILALVNKSPDDYYLHLKTPTILRTIMPTDVVYLNTYKDEQYITLSKSQTGG
jgi:hypothetical protein